MDGQENRDPFVSFQKEQRNDEKEIIEQQNSTEEIASMCDEEQSRSRQNAADEIIYDAEQSVNAFSFGDDQDTVDTAESMNENKGKRKHQKKSDTTKSKEKRYCYSGSLFGKICNHVMFLISLIVLNGCVIGFFAIEESGFYYKAKQEIYSDIFDMDTDSEVAVDYYLIESGKKTVSYNELQEIKNTLNPQYTNFRCRIYDKKGVCVAETYDETLDQGTVMMTKSFDFGQYEVYAYILDPKKTGINDRYALNKKIVDIMYAMRIAIIPIGMIAFLMMIFFFILIIVSAGRKSMHRDIVQNQIDKIPLDVLVVLEFLLLCFAYKICCELSSSVANVVLVTFFGSVTIILGLIGFESFSVRCKMQTLDNIAILIIFKKLFQLMRAFGKLLYDIMTKIPYSLLAIIGMGVYLLLIIGTGSITFVVLSQPILYLLIFKNVLDFQKIKKQIDKVSEGKMECDEMNGYMLPWFRDMRQSVAQIKDGLLVAIQEQVKSERMKTELITNVSHDIKTPLTSIINYVDLIKGTGELQSEEGKKYLEVLERQSFRLKKMTEDLVQFSKANTGNMEVHPENTPIIIMLEQALAEYEDKLTQKGLQIVKRIDREETCIYVDGRMTWRVLDNLFSNICKYALPDSRVYIDIMEEQTIVNMIIKNISEDPLNISGEELRERFVRGDSSRNTEGSGLGLSIAESFMEAMKGTFDVSVDGDLFKVTLTFPKNAEK